MPKMNEDVKKTLELQDSNVLGKDWETFNQLFSLEDGLNPETVLRMKFIALLFFKRGQVHGKNKEASR